MHGLGPVGKRHSPNPVELVTKRHKPDAIMATPGSNSTTKATSGNTPLTARPYQVELLEKAKKNNIIVYLGTGSGKTFIAVMLIKHLRDSLVCKNTKAVFLVNNVALLEQQAQVIRDCTGLSTGSFCGADGVDDWGRDKWGEEMKRYKVLVFIHQVFLNALSAGYISISHLAALIIDECHHTVDNHPYSKIMRDWYHQAKKNCTPLPRVLGLSASLVVKAVKVEKFRQEKAKLEAALDAKVETADEISLELFVNSAREKIVSYPRPLNNTTETVKSIDHLINQAIGELELVKDQQHTSIKKGGGDANSKATSYDSLKKDFKYFKNDIFGAAEALLTLGVYSLVAMEKVMLEDVRRKTGSSENIWYSEATMRRMGSITKTYLEKIFFIGNREMEGFSGDERMKIYKFSSPKVIKLVEQLQCQGWEDRELSVSMRCIVFVERKLTSMALYYLIDQLSLSTVTDVGYAYSPGTGRNVKDPRERGEVNNEKRKLNKTLHSFRTGAINVLVSTSVVEEGLDVPSCNLVIKFDFPQTYRSYIQSKGRARKEDSRYILLVEDGDEQRQAKYKEWLDVYKMSMTECHYKEKVGLLGIVEDEEREFFSTSEARVDGTQALVLLHQYLQKIPVDRFTRLTPAWSYQEAHSNQVAQSLLLAGLGVVETPQGAGYRATVQLPHKTPLQQPVSGELRARKELAKCSAALEVVRLLFECGELDIHLKVKKREKAEEEEEDDDDDGTGKKSGTRGRRRFYPVSPPLSLKLLDEGPYILHKLSLRLVKPVPNPRYQLHLPQHDSHCLGLLCSTPLPLVEDLDIFSPSGHIKAEIHHMKEVQLTSMEVHQLLRFHQYLLTTCLAVTKLMDYTRQPSPMLVPLLGDTLDLALCDKVLKHALAPSSVQLDTNSLTLARQSGNIDFYLDLVLSPLVTGALGPNYYFVEEVMEKMTVSSWGPGMGMTFLDYYRSHHNTKIKDKKQPIIRIAAADKRDYMLKEGGEPVADGKARNHFSFKVPELMGVEPVSAGLWKQAQMVPWVLHRLSGLLGVLPLTLSSFYQTPNRSLRLVPGKEDSRAPDQLMKFLLGSGAPSVGPTAGQVLKALTLPAADDPWDMERMEILGDAFLKYSTTVFLFYKLGSEDQTKTTMDEGDLTRARSGVVGNRNFFRVSESLELVKLMVVKKMDLQLSWSPPGYQSTRVGLETLEEMMVRLDSQMVKEHGWEVGNFCRWVTWTDMQKVVAGGDKEELVVLARQRRKAQDREGLGVGVELRDFRMVSDKSQADCVEAMIGCHLLYGGISGALQLMSEVGLRLDRDSSLTSLLDRERGDGRPVTPCRGMKDVFCNEVARGNKEKMSVLLAKLGSSEIERIVGYTFKEKSFLLQAFTHPSFGDNRLTDSYERLEFLGDAVLDYLVTCYIYSHSTSDPGKLTDTRSALVNNNTFASLLTDKKLDQYILHCTPGLYSKIRAYMEDKRWQEERDKNSGDKVDRNLNLINEVEPPELDMVEVPKVLGDVFEALIGAIYLDSGHNLDRVWTVYRRFCIDLEEVVRNPPLNIKKQLMEKFPHVGDVKFDKAKVQEMSGMVMVTVEVPGREEGAARRRFVGRGRNKRLAEMAACKCALRKIRDNI